MSQSMDFHKPANWQTLPLYKKVEIYGLYLNKTHAPYVDKIQVKPLVRSLTNNRIKVAKVIRELRTPDDVQTEDIHPNHLIKAAHGSGWLIDLAETEAEAVDLPAIKKRLWSWNHIYSQSEAQYNVLY